MTSERRIIGAASEFYRVRVMSVDATDEPDFEWHDDILYRAPSVDQPEERVLWAVEAVALDDAETVTRIACFESYGHAMEFLGSVREDLAELTKSGFEEQHLGKA